MAHAASRIGHVPRVPRDHVQVQVHDRLASRWPDVDPHVEAVGAVRGRQALDRPVHLAPQGCLLGLRGVEIGHDVATRHHEGMPRAHGEGVREGGDKVLLGSGSVAEPSAEGTGFAHGHGVPDRTGALAPGQRDLEFPPEIQVALFNFSCYFQIMNRERSARDARAQTTAFGQLLGTGYRPAASGNRSPFDFESLDGRTIIDLKGVTAGARDLRASLLQLALALRERPGVERGVLVTRIGPMGGERILEELDKLDGVLRAELAGRLCIVGVHADGAIVMPHRDDVLALIQDAAVEVLGGVAARPPLSRWTRKTFSIWLSLLESWLRDEGPVPLGVLGERADCTYPTVRTALERLENLGELRRHSSRGASFGNFPRRSLEEILVLGAEVRPGQAFIDASGRPPDMMRTLRRLRAAAPQHVALGGVVAARHHVQMFDLNGIPRIDVTVNGAGSLDWLEAVDPALQPVDQADMRDTTPILVVHRLDMGDPRFEPGADGGRAIVGRAETLLDLYDLRLTTQADEFVKSLCGMRG